uniref:Myb-like domain-containing protein n=1 Tax=Globisporangium ultimum (strain ATCC 200006 / CBS 805.95 / DAOM BR144) TaxID=431595 RepID=K3X6L7_GLOUD
MHHKQYPMKEMRGKISQEQCVQLASQMHKHFQLLMQNFHLFALPTDENMEAEEAAWRMAKLGDDVTEYEAKEADPETRKQRKREALQECQKMMEELKVRGEKAQKCKEALLSKLNPSASQPNQDAISSRRVTRSLTAAHAAVAHPSMFELVGSNSLDELTSKFLNNCLVEERDLAIQDQMLEIDKHLLLTQKKNPKKPFTPSEDKLLAHGVKRFHLDDESWVLIEKHFLPGKKLPVIRRRFRYLTSNKTGMSAVKAYHSQFPKRRDASWILEEDLRIARGMIEFHNDSKRFARVGLKYLPHRGRLEIRKRWERIRQKFEPEIAVQNPNIDDSSIDYAVLMKDLLEDKLREQVLRQSKKIVEEPPQQAQNSLSYGTSKLGNQKKYVFRAAEKEYNADVSAIEMKLEDAPGQHQQQGDHTTNGCQVKNLHPALFFTSWALINPSILLTRTCEHNWPSFIDELSGEPKEDDAASAAIMAGPTSPAAEELSATDAQSTENEHVEEQSVDEPPLRSKQRVRTLPTRKKPSQQAAASTAQPKPPGKKSVPKSADSESEPSMMANSSASCEDEDEDDSDYEHDELVSSENDQESDSEFEQMELSDDDEDEEEHDDDDDDDNDDDFEYEELDDDDDEEDDETVAPAAVEVRQQGINPPKESTPPTRSARVAMTRAVPPAAASSGKKASPPLPKSSSPAPLRHPLRLQNLSKPGNERMKRALEALERRIVGKSVGCSLSVADTNLAAAQRPRKPATRVAFSNEPLAPGRKRPDESRHNPFRVEIQAIGFPKELDLETDEVLASSSGDDSFEREELRSSDDDEHPGAQAPAVHLDNGIEKGHSYMQDVARDMLISDSGWRPAKKPKLSCLPCEVCRNAPCVCANARRAQHVPQQRMRPSSASAIASSSSRKA